MAASVKSESGLATDLHGYQIDRDLARVAAVGATPQRLWQRCAMEAPVEGTCQVTSKAMLVWPVSQDNLFRPLGRALASAGHQNKCSERA